MLVDRELAQQLRELPELPGAAAAPGVGARLRPPAAVAGPPPAAGDDDVPARGLLDELADDVLTTDGRRRRDDDRDAPALGAPLARTGDALGTLVR